MVEVLRHSAPNAMAGDSRYEGKTEWRVKGVPELYTNDPPRYVYTLQSNPGYRDAGSYVTLADCKLGKNNVKAKIRNFIDGISRTTSSGNYISDAELNKLTNMIMTSYSKNAGKYQKDGLVKPSYSKVQHSLYTEVFDEDDYLEHHGILGMKWGVRRYQNEDGSLTNAGRKHYGVQSSSSSDISSRKGMQKRLNDVDKAIVRNKRHFNDSTANADYYQKKANKAKTDEKHDKYNRKAEEERIKAKQYSDNISKGQKEVDDILKKVVDNGYTVKTQVTPRSVDEGKDILIKTGLNLATIGVGILVGAPLIPIAIGSTAPGTKYKVKETK